MDRRFCDGKDECIAFKSIPSKEKELINYLENSKERINDYLFDGFFEEIQRGGISKADLSIKNNKYSYLVGAPAGEVVLLNDCCYFINRGDLPEFEKTIFRDEKTDDFIRIDSYLYRGVDYSGSTAFVKYYYIKPISLCEKN
ncbi:hypothetical protein VQ643_12155 [Pseudomonas sp. F1_0610]|uniref:hypothetical protein n=1 Tax=Pseudomonas sp. F1_0610 TaxID=3114284 RepID=UPI0039C1120A